MADDQREIRRKPRVLAYAELSEDVSTTRGTTVLAEPVSNDGDRPTGLMAKLGWSVREGKGGD